MSEEKLLFLWMLVLTLLFVGWAINMSNRIDAIHEARTKAVTP